MTYLAFGVSRLTDMCNAFCRWESSRTQVRNLFTRQAVSMLWDYAENNPFNDAGGDFRTSLRSVIRSIERLPTSGSAEVMQRTAHARVASLSEVVVSSDPPYYDSVPYSDISDFFYVWLRRGLRNVWPDECATLLTPKMDELVADSQRFGSKVGAKQHFETGMALSLIHISEPTRPY